MPWRGLRVLIARMFGWTFEHVDLLDETDLLDIMAVLDGISKADK